MAMITDTFLSPMTEADHVKAVHVFTEKNPQPDVASFRRGGGRFEDVTEASGTAFGRWAWSCAFLDHDSEPALMSWETLKSRTPEHLKSRIDALLTAQAQRSAS